MRIKKVLAIVLSTVLAVSLAVPFAVSANAVPPVEGKVTGGGLIETGKGKDAAKITFGGNVNNLGGELSGHWSIIFHNVNEPDAIGHFQSTEITSLIFYVWADCPNADPPASDCNWAMFEANGKFNGEDGWSIEVSLDDFGEPGRQTDAIRIILYDHYGFVYDTSESFLGDFDDEGCSSGDARMHLLDGGNLQIRATGCGRPY